MDLFVCLILQKLMGDRSERTKAMAKEILEVQKGLWEKHKIDPFVSADILVWARLTSGQHGVDAMRPVVDALKKALDTNVSKDVILRILRGLGDTAAGR